MLLDFTFEMNDLAGRRTGVTAKDFVLNVFNSTNAGNSDYRDKKKDWAPRIAKSGQIEVDVTDARKIKEWLVKGPFADYAIIAVGDYIDRRIEATVVETSKKDKRKRTQ